MKIIDVQQGSPAWLAERARRRGASEAAAMMGVGRHMTRNQLLDLKAGGVEKQASWFMEELRARGHEVEASARLLIEDMLGEALYQVTASDDDDWLLASSDGVTMDEVTAFEHKLWNADIVAQVERQELEPWLYWQLEQQILVLGVERIIFVCSDGTADRMRWMEYRAVAGRREKLIAGWRQFDLDLAAHSVVLDKPTVAAPIMPLLTLTARVRGEVVDTNLVAYRERALEFVAAIKTELVTDQDFVDADANVKACAQAEKMLAETKDRALADTASIDELFRTVDVLRETFRARRLMLEKLVVAEKNRRKQEILTRATDAAMTHVAGLRDRLGRQHIELPSLDLAATTKNLRTLASMRNAVDTALAHWKIAANEEADRIDQNQRVFGDMVSMAYVGLFPDAEALTAKPQEDMITTIRMRLADDRARREREAATPAPTAAPTMAPAALPESMRSWVGLRGTPTPHGRTKSGNSIHAWRVVDIRLIPSGFLIVDHDLVNTALWNDEPLPPGLEWVDA